MFNSQRYLAAIALTLIFSCVGCGGGKSSGPTGTVKGKVTKDGQPVAGTIYFNAGAEGKSGTAVLQADGSYKLTSEFGEKIPVGTYKVSVTPGGGGPSTDITAAPGGDPSKGPIPAKYLSGDTSGWTADVKAGENTFDFKVE